MAEKALKKVEEGLNCSICLDTYTDPKLLQCFHSYCQQCLVPLVDRNKQGKLGLSCPTCRQVTPIPDRGVAGLQSAFHINHLLEIRESLRNRAATPEGEAIKKVNHCPLHEKELELYCEPCGELICWKCIAKGSRHHDHDYDELDEAFAKYKTDITSLIEPMEKQVEIIKKVLAKLDASCGTVSHQQVVIEDNIRVIFGQIQEALNARETELIVKLDQMTREKLKGLAAQRDQIETTLTQLNSCLHFMRESLNKPGNAGDVLPMKTNTVIHVKDIITTPFHSEPNKRADIVFRVSSDMIAICQNYGKLVLLTSLPDPSSCHVTGEIAEVAVAGDMVAAVVQAINFDGKPCEEVIKSFECELVSEITGTRASCRVMRKGQSQYKISYQPTIKGRHQLHIKAEGQHIRGSPFHIAVKSPVENLGIPIRAIIGVGDPRGVAINQKGEIVVTECGGHHVSMFSLSGEKLCSFGTYGSGQGQFLSPSGVAVDGEGNIMVVDNRNHRVQKFSVEGRWSMVVGGWGNAPKQFSFPTDIAFNGSNKKVYVVDAINAGIRVLNPDFTFFSTFGKKGSGKGQFRSPNGIACDSTGKVYVTDFDDHCIQVFTAEGKFVMMFGRHGQGRGELDGPVGVAIDASDMVHVSEWGNHRISVFTTKGQFVTSFGRPGKGPGEFKHPYGLAVDLCGVVYVCDSINNRVQLF